MSNSVATLRAGSFIASLGDMADVVGDEGEARMEVAANHLEGEIKVRSPVDTGHLRASYSSIIETSGDTVTGHVGTNTEYAAHQEFYGTPHIRPAIDANESKLIKLMAEDTLSNAVGHL